MGRGVLFGAVDLFAPFSPLEADREWRRGIDAARAEVRLSDRFSVDAVAALGESLGTSALAARVRGYAGDVDGELRRRLARPGSPSRARRRSAAVGGAELHGELCAFFARDPLRAAARGGTSGSPRRRSSEGLTGSPSGAASSGSPSTTTRGSAPGRHGTSSRCSQGARSRERLARGDTQLLGRHAVALLGTLELTNELATQALVLVSPSDGSGVLAPAATYTLSDAASVNATLYVPWGAKPEGLTLRSEYGATPLSFFVQVRLYD